MIHRSRIIILILILIGLFFFISGCTMPRTGDTHNITTALQSYNTWTAEQKQFDRQVHLTIAQIGDHLNAYNVGIAQDQPDITTLRGNVAADRQILDQWGTDLAILTAATDQFSTDTAALDYGNSPQTKQTIDQLTQYMKIYTIDMGNAQQHLIDYTTNADMYMSPDDPAYWNDVYLNQAMTAKSQAMQSIADADNAIAGINSNAQQLQELQ
jgi:hypothetical protein